MFAEDVVAVAEEALAVVVAEVVSEAAEVSAAVEEEAEGSEEAEEEDSVDVNKLPTSFNLFIFCMIVFYKYHDANRYLNYLSGECQCYPSGKRVDTAFQVGEISKKPENNDPPHDF